MSELNSCFSEKMEYLYKDIVASLVNLPMDQRGFLFGYEDELDMDWVIGMANYITLEYIKYAFDNADPEYSLRHFRQGENDTDDERMRQSRIMDYVLRYKQREVERSGIALPSGHKFAAVSMDTIEKKLQGHRLTELNYFEHQNIHDVELIKAIVEKRICSSKKISNSRFQEMFSQYDDLIESMITKSQNSDQELVFYAIAYFTLEWH